MVFFIMGFFLPIILWCISLGLKVTLKSYMILMDGQEGNLSHSLYNKLNSGRSLTGSIKTGIRNTKRLGKATVKAGKTAYKVGKTAYKVGKTVIITAIKVIKLIISAIKALIALISASTVCLVILVILLFVVLIAAIVTVIIGSENATSGKATMNKTTIGEIRNSNKASGKKESSSEEGGIDTVYSEDISERIVQVACEYAKNQKLKYVYGGSGKGGGIDCSHFACGVVLEATGYSWDGRKASKKFKVTDGISYAYYKTTEGLWGAPEKIVVKRTGDRKEFISTADVKKLAKPGDILVNDRHAAIYYGTVKGTAYWIEASETNGTGCATTMDNAVKKKTGYSVGISPIRNVSCILRPAIKITKLNK